MLARTSPHLGFFPTLPAEHYRLVCAASGAVVPEARRGFALGDPAARTPGLLRAEYEEASFRVEDREPGLFRWRAWLPVRRVVPGAPQPVCWRAERLGAALGLRNLHVVFGGWDPARGARFRTGTFKELEAYAVLGRWPDGDDRTMVLASAGNTARAFLEVASRYGVPVLTVVPERALRTLATTIPRHPCTRVVAVRDGDYSDAIAIAGALARRPGYFPEGGCRNVARRDGLGTTVLAALEAMGRLPDLYVQAVGSGTGAIGAWEMAERARRAGRPGGPMEVLLVQDGAHCPLYRAWQADARHEAPLPRIGPEPLHAHVLTNRTPPYAVAGGVRDILAASGGGMRTATATEAREAGRLFMEREGVSLHPAAEIGLAGLIAAVRAGRVPREAHLLFNATGGGLDALEKVLDHHPVQPDRVVPRVAPADVDALALTLAHDLEDR
jgi:cysteate synthase